MLNDGAATACTQYAYQPWRWFLPCVRWPIPISAVSRAYALLTFRARIWRNERAVLGAWERPVRQANLCACLRDDLTTARDPKLHDTLQAGTKELTGYGRARGVTFLPQKVIEPIYDLARGRIDDGIPGREILLMRYRSNNVTNCHKILL